MGTYLYRTYYSTSMYFKCAAFNAETPVGAPTSKIKFALLQPDTTNIHASARCARRRATMQAGRCCSCCTAVLPPAGIALIWQQLALTRMSHQRTATTSVRGSYDGTDAGFTAQVAELRGNSLLATRARNVFAAHRAARQLRAETKRMADDEPSWLRANGEERAPRRTAGRTPGTVRPGVAWAAVPDDLGHNPLLSCASSLWRERLLQLRAAGFNTVETYVPWNHPAPTPGGYVRRGRRVPRLRRVPLRGTAGPAPVRAAGGRGWPPRRGAPGPFICAEWEFGGLPAAAGPRLRAGGAVPAGAGAAARQRAAGVVRSGADAI